MTGVHTCVKMWHCPNNATWILDEWSKLIISCHCFKLKTKDCGLPQEQHPLKSYLQESSSLWICECVRPPATTSSQRGLVRFTKICDSSHWICRALWWERGSICITSHNQKVYPMSWGHGEKMNKGSSIRLALYIADNLSSHFCHLSSPHFCFEEWGIDVRKIRGSKEGILDAWREENK